jgi:hypothetical protein
MPRIGADTQFGLATYFARIAQFRPVNASASTRIFIIVSEVSIICS